MKRCLKCAEDKPIDQFHRHRRQKDGRYYYCKGCVRTLQREYQQRPEVKKRNRKRLREWKRNHPDRVRKANAPSAARRNTARSDALRAQKTLMDRRCAHCNEPIPVEKRVTTIYCSRRCKHNAVCARLYAEKGEKIREQQAAYRRRHPQRAREKKARRRALEADAFVAKVEIAEIARRDDGFCGICGEQIQIGQESLDHVVPLSRGGTHEPGNVQLAHRSCNFSKRNRMPTAQELQTFRERVLIHG